MKRPVYVCCVFNVYSDFPDDEFAEETAEERRMRKEWRGHVAGFTPEEAHAATCSLYDKSCDLNWYLPAHAGEYAIVVENGRELVDGDPICPRCGRTF